MKGGYKMKDLRVTSLASNSVLRGRGTSLSKKEQKIMLLKVENKNCCFPLQLRSKNRFIDLIGEVVVFKTKEK